MNTTDMTWFVILFAVAACALIFTVLWTNRFIYMSAYNRLLVAVEFIQAGTIKSSEKLDGIPLRLITAKVVEFAQQEDAVFKAAKKRFRLLSKLFVFLLVVLGLLVVYLLFSNPGMFISSQLMSIAAGVWLYYKAPVPWAWADPSLNFLSKYVKDVAIVEQIDGKWCHPRFILNLEETITNFGKVIGEADYNMRLVLLMSLLPFVSWSLKFFLYSWYGAG